MTESASIQAYLLLAEGLNSARVNEDQLEAEAAQLPPLDEQLIEDLAEKSHDAGLARPRMGWAIAAAVDAAARVQDIAPFLRALAAWFVGRAANHWVQPGIVEEATLRARRIFETLEMPGWIAACDWQRFALPWTHNDFQGAADGLDRALEGMLEAEFERFIPECRLSVAYAQILTRAFDEAILNLDLCEKEFETRGDSLNMARCWLNQASRLRRQDKFDDALDMLERARTMFDGLNAPIERAKADFQIAYCYFARADDYLGAIENFNRAARVYSESDLELYYAECSNGLAQVHTHLGNLTEAAELLHSAREVYERYDIAGIRADNTNDIGLLEMSRGRFNISLEYFKQAETLYDELGVRLYAAIAITNQGRVYAQHHRFQDALHHLERARTIHRSINNLSRLAACEMYLSQVWSLLGQPVFAHAHLDKAAELFNQTDQEALLAKVFNSRAKIFFAQDMWSEAIAQLENALAVSKAYNSRPQIALAQRLLGEALTTIGNVEKALESLTSAESNFAEMGMVMEQAASLVALGNHYVQVEATEMARVVFGKALDLSEGNMPAIDWRAHAGLAGLAESDKDLQTALDTYRQAITVFNKLRGGFWQPALAAAYLQNPSASVDRAVTLAAEVNAPLDAIHFIESSKAQTLLQLLTEPNVFGGASGSAELTEVENEINWLRERMLLTVDPHTRLQTSEDIRNLRARLIEKVEQYDTLAARLERQAGQEGAGEQTHQSFDLSSFQHHATITLGNSWMALDYYMTGSHLTGVAVTPEGCHVWRAPVTGRADMALSMCVKTRRSMQPPNDGDLEALGSLLIPGEIEEQLSPETTLIIVPHRDLHQVPWAALRMGLGTRSLVDVCLPVVTPSLHALTLLWQRAIGDPPPARKDGLLLGLSDFKGLRRQLPGVAEEIAVLAPRLGPKGKKLIGTEATWENLSALSQEDDSGGLSRFAWLHVASHIFYDSRSGRLSSIALHDGDLWQDRLRDLAPLPDLVTFSACNGTQRVVYEGDEHVGLPTTCLIAGAESVVGSIWPVPDVAAVTLMDDFYTHYLSGLRPSKALALAQRQALARGSSLRDWASFTCIGLP